MQRDGLPVSAEQHPAVTGLPSTIAGLLARNAREHPAIAAILAPGREPLCYRELFEFATEVIDSLRRFGFARHHKVAVLATGGPEMATAVTAISAGCVCVPLNPAFTADEWQRYLVDLQVSVAVIQHDIETPCRDVARELDIPVIDLVPQTDKPAGMFVLQAGFELAPVTDGFGEPDDHAFVLPTSGTTSRPKTVPLTHANICYSGNSVVQSVALTRHDRLLNVLPFHHAHGLISGLFSVLVSTSGIICAPGFVAARFLGWLEDFKPTWITGVPTIHQAILKEAQSSDVDTANTSLRLIRSASSSLPGNIFEALEKQFGVPVIEGYGMTEAASQIASNPMPPLPRKIGSVGVAAGPELAIFDADGNALGAGQTGEIVMRGPNVTAGYLSDDAANAAGFYDSWMRTGDLGYLDSDGYLFIVGRIKEIINRGGQKIAPREVEEVLIEHPVIAEVAAFPTAHANLGEDVGVAIVLKPDAGMTNRELRRFAAQKLASHKIPRKIYVVPEIPRQATGKIQRALLEKHLSDADVSPLRDRRGSRREPRTDIERALVEIWAEVLDRPNIGVLDDFFLQGGDSLNATQAISRIKKRLAVDVPMSAFFDAATVEALAGYMEAEARSGSRQPATAHPLPADELPRQLSYSQHRLYILSKLDLTDRAYEVAEVLLVQGRLDVRAMQESISAIAGRHDALRTTFQDDGGTLVQVVHAHDPAQISIKERGCLRDADDPTDALCRTVVATMGKGSDLATGPLIRVELYQLGRDRYGLVVVLHHLITDAWSQAIFWHELQQCYSARISGSLPDLAEIQFQYRDFAAWQAQWLKTSEASRQRAYWRTQLQGLTAVSVPADRPRPPVWTGRGARYPVRFSQALTRKLRSLSRRQGATLFMTLMAAFQCQLHRLTGTDDVAVGTFIANRDLIETENVMGMFVNTLVVRTDLGGDPPFQVLLQKVKQAALKAYENQNLPFELVVREIQASRRGDRSGPIQTMFVLQSAPPEVPTLDGLSTRFLEVDPKISRTDLTLELFDQTDNLCGWIEYSTDLFDEQTIARIATQFDTLLKSIVADPASPVSGLDLLTEKQKRDMLFCRFTHTHVDHGDLRLADLIVRQVNKTPDQVAVSDGTESLTYAALYEASACHARQLMKLGVGPDTVVVVLANRDCAFLSALVAVILAGGAFLAVDPDHPEQRQRQIVSGSEASVILASGECRQAAAQIAGGIAEHARPRVLTLNEISNGAPDAAFTPAAPRHDDLAYVIYTSGTSGAPKGAMIEQLGLLNHLRSKADDLQLTEDDVVAQTAPQTFDIAVWQFLTALLAGGRVHICDTDTVRDAGMLAREVDQAGITVLQVVPVVLQSILDARRRGLVGEQLRRLRWMICTGEELPVELCRSWFEQFADIPLINAYGPAECGDDVAIHIMREPPPAHCASVPIGQPIANTRLYVLDAALEPVPVGIVGELYVGGSGVGRGYLNDREQTGQSFLADPFAGGPDARLYRTGDLVRHCNDGTLEFLGRADDQLKVRGLRIEPQEIEHLLETRDGIARAVVVLRNQAVAGKQLVAFMQLTAGNELAVSRLKSFLRTRLPDYMIPAGFIRVDQFPLTSHGKIDRRALSENSDVIDMADTAHVAARTATERCLQGIWREFLAVSDFGIHDNFFDLGGHSLLASRILAKISTKLNVSLPLRSLFDHPTIADLAQRLEAAETQAVVAPVPDIQKAAASGVPRPTITQEHVLDAEQFLPGLPQFSLPFAFKIAGPLDAGLLQRCIAEVVRRHDALRTRFIRKQDRWVMDILPEDDCQVVIEVEDFSIFELREAQKLAVMMQTSELRKALKPGNWPLFRFRLMKLDAATHILLFTIHHAITDGWSIGILFEEISKSYEAFLNDRQPDYPDNAIQFSDFASWQRQWSKSPGAAAQVRFWRDKLRSASPVFAGAAYGSPDVQAGGLAYVPLEVSGELFNGIRELSRSNECTTFITLLAGFMGVLHRTTGLSDLCVGTAMANRRIPSTDRIMGLVENTVLVRTELAGNNTGSDLLRVVREALLEAFSYQELPFEQLALRLKEESDIDVRPLLDVFFINQNPYRSSLQLPGLQTNGFGDPHREGQPVMPVNRSRMRVMLKETPGGVIGSCAYRRDCFSKPVMEQLLAGYREVLVQMVEGPEMPVRPLIFQ
ncbi:MAG: amino acid adenylation domain-containing protein [Anderseniella sp.]